MNLHQWRQHLKQFNKSFEKNKDLFQEWTDNTTENLPLFNKGNSIWNTENLYLNEKEKAMVLVGASPCLSMDVSKLRTMNGDFRIICANSSLKFLLRHEVKPHYVICLDSDRLDIPQHLDCDSKDITLLASSVVCSEALNNWKGPIYFMPYYSIDPKLRSKVRAKLGKKVKCGGNSITAALALATVIWGAKTVIFVANEFCFDDRYYADKKAAKQEKISMVYPCIDVRGKNRWTLPALYIYNVWTEKICTDLTPPGYFIDTSFGLLGKDTDAIHLMELSEAIKKVKWAFSIKNKFKKAKTDKEKVKIVEGIIPKHDQSEVYRYNVQEQRPELLRLARS